MDFSALKHKRTVVIVGVSEKPDRTSRQLFQRLSGRAEFEVIPVHPKLKELEGKPVMASISEINRSPDILTLYVNSEISKGMEGDILKMKPGKVIFNPGAENPELQMILEKNGIATEEACSLVLLSQNAL